MRTLDGPGGAMWFRHPRNRGRGLCWPRGSRFLCLQKVFVIFLSRPTWAENVRPGTRPNTERNTREEQRKGWVTEDSVDAGGGGEAEQGAGDLGSHGVATERRNGDPDGHERRAAGNQSLSGSSLPPPHSQYKFLRQRKKLQSCPGGEGEEQGPPRKGPPGRLLSGRQSVRPHRGVRVFVG